MRQYLTRVMPCIVEVWVNDFVVARLTIPKWDNCLSTINRNEFPRPGRLRFSPSRLRNQMTLRALFSKKRPTALTIGIFTALLFSAVLGLTYQWNPSPTAKQPGSEFAGMDTKSLMAKFRVQPLDRVPIPNFQLKDLDGKLVGMASFRGKVVLLNIWATW